MVDEALARQLDALSGPRTRRWLADVAADWTLAALALGFIGLCLRTPWLYPLIPVALLVVGAAQHRLAFMGHDAIPHGCAHANRRVNDALAALLCFWPIGFSVVGWRLFHSTHHDTVGTGADPEVWGHRGKPILAQWHKPWHPLTAAAVLLGDLLGLGLPHVKAASALTGPPRKRDKLSLLLFHAALAAPFFGLGWWWVPCAWWASLVTASWALLRLRIQLEHLGLEDTGHGEAATHRVLLPWYVRWAVLPHHGDRHWMHHWCWDNPPGRKRWAIPTWNSPAADELLLRYRVGPAPKGLWEYLRESS
jgi:fatty acid desaturase